METFKPNPEQAKVIDCRTGCQIVVAGAGSGKTATMVEQLGRCVTVDQKGLDSIVSITFTEKAAGELKNRVRKWLLRQGKVQEAYNVESSSISTIHGFCASLIRKNSLYLGLDPAFAVLDDVKSNILKREAVIKATEEFLSGAVASDRLRFANIYDVNSSGNFAASIIQLCDELRGRGCMTPELPPLAVQPVDDRDLAPLINALIEALAHAGDCNASKTRDDEICRFREALEISRSPEKLVSMRTAEIERLLKVSLGAGSPGYKAAKSEIRSLAASLVARINDLNAIQDYDLTKEFFGLYVKNYDLVKQWGGYLDFEDLQLYACDLLERNEDIRRELRERIWLFQIDEFQDTNPLQAKIINLIDPGNLSIVGDRNQSIYSFRHADVTLFDQFTEQGRKSGQVNHLSTNYRSNLKILWFLNHIFSSEGFFGGKYVNLQVNKDDGQKSDPGNCVIEVSAIETQTDDGKLNIRQLREKEAELIAEKMARLRENDAANFGDMALLLRKFTNLDIYEKALQRHNIPYHVSSRQYFERSEIRDINSYLKILANPLDDLNFAAVMKSPFVRLSDETLFALASVRRAQENASSLLEAVRHVEETAVGSQAFEKLSSFIKTFDSIRSKSGQVAISELIELVISETGYDIAVLSLPYQSEAIFANIRKLIRQADTYQQLYGSDIRGFTDYIEEAKIAAEKEGSAQIESEEGDAVKIMTVHGAKGLQFGYVFAADLTSTFEPSSGFAGANPVILHRPDPDMPYGGIGFRWSPDFSENIKVYDYERACEQKKAVETEEQKRVLYVALSRAIKGLFLSGGIQAAKPKGNMIETIIDNLAYDREEFTGKGRTTAKAGNAELTLLYYQPGDIDFSQAEFKSAVKSKKTYDQANLIKEHYDIKAPVVSRLSASSLEQFKECPAKFYFKNVLKLKSKQKSEASPGTDTKPWTAVEYGNIAHYLLYKTDWTQFEAYDDLDIINAVAKHIDLNKNETAEIAACLAEDINRLVASDIGRQLASADLVEKEVPFAFCVNDVVLHGFMDALINRNTVIDYKTGSPGGKGDGAYKLQTDLYSLALLKAGADEVISKIVFLKDPDDTVISSYSNSDIEELEQRFASLIKAINSSDFLPAKQAAYYICDDCPGHGTTCSI